MRIPLLSPGSRFPLVHLLTLHLTLWLFLISTPEPVSADLNFDNFNFDSLKSRLPDLNPILNPIYALDNAITQSICRLYSTTDPNDPGAPKEHTAFSRLFERFRILNTQLSSAWQELADDPASQAVQEKVAKLLKETSEAYQQLLDAHPNAKQFIDQVYEVLNWYEKLQEEHPWLHTAALSGVMWFAPGFGLALSGFGALGPLKGRLAPWLQRTFYGAAVPQGSPFAYFQRMGMVGASPQLKVAMAGIPVAVRIGMILLERIDGSKCPQAQMAAKDGESKGEKAEIKGEGKWKQVKEEKVKKDKAATKEGVKEEL